MTLKLPATTLVANCASATLFDATSGKVDRSGLEAAFRTIICWTGDDPNRDGLIETPARMARALAEHFAGYAVDPAAIAGYDETIVLAGIPFVSHCEHHMAPIVGRAWVGYTPRGRVVGISKLARVVDAFARRLQIQERMTAQIAGAVEEALQPEGVGVVLKAVHHCMSARGVHKPGVELVTSRMLGSFRDDPETRKEFLRIATSTPAAQA